MSGMTATLLQLPAKTLSKHAIARGACLSGSALRSARCCHSLLRYPLTHPRGLRSFHATCATASALVCNTSSFLRNIRNGAEIYLVGTAHISEKSVQEVRDTIALVRPDTVMVELCEQRRKQLMSGKQRSQMDVISEMMNAVGRGGMSALPGALAGAGISTFYRWLATMGFEPGKEFKVAVEDAGARGARVVCGDRDVRQTTQQLAQCLSFADVMRLLTLSESAVDPELRELFDKHDSLDALVEAMKTRRTARAMVQLMKQTHPQLADALIFQRDRHMANVLHGLHGRVVAVVGLAHLDGIERHWDVLQNSSIHAVKT